mmetsp:Transcript_35179/g.100723  ORF Transcript_35179/g.100723 Transcript_35179/m.100723 type:complete len:333 (+) Transcript_35179:1710-2708(+)
MPGAWHADCRSAKCGAPDRRSSTSPRQPWRPPRPAARPSTRTSARPSASCPGTSSLRAPRPDWPDCQAAAASFSWPRRAPSGRDGPGAEAAAGTPPSARCSAPRAGYLWHCSAGTPALRSAPPCACGPRGGSRPARSARSPSSSPWRHRRRTGTRCRVGSPGPPRCRRAAGPRPPSAGAPRAARTTPPGCGRGAAGSAARPRGRPCAAHSRSARRGRPPRGSRPGGGAPPRGPAAGSWWCPPACARLPRRRGRSSPPASATPTREFQRRRPGLQRALLPCGVRSPASRAAPRRGARPRGPPAACARGWGSRARSCSRPPPGSPPSCPPADRC